VLHLFVRIFVTIIIVVIVDNLLGFVWYVSKKSDVSCILARSRATRRAIIVFPGYTMLGNMVGRAFTPYVNDDDTIITVDYGEQLIDPQEISEGILIKLRWLQPTELIVYGGSMGGMAAKLFLDQYRWEGMPYGKVKLVLDTVPASRKDIKRPFVLFALSYVLRGGPISSAVWAVLAMMGKKPPREADADAELLEKFYKQQTYVGMTAVATQTRFIAEFPALKDRELTDVAQEVIYLHGEQPQHLRFEADPLVWLGSSVASWRKAFPSMETRVITGRDSHLHLPLIEFPKATVKAILAE
jgi:pimeloyl-ACP methyl ester carboxylesterase